MAAKIKLIVGLGNPGLSYKKTRHNAGARAVEKLAQKNGLAFKHNRTFKSLLALGKVQGAQVCLALPKTFMNRSGDAVAALVKQKDVPLEDLLVVCDDVALPLGGLKVKPRGSAGGHKGLAGIIGALGTQDFARMRLGIAGAKAGEDLADYVLSVFKKDEEIPLRRMLDKAVEALECWVTEGMGRCMNKYNQAPRCAP